VQVCARLTELLDAVLLELYQAAASEATSEVSPADLAGVSLVAHSGYGRQEMAPYSDVDLMLLWPSGSGERFKPLVRRFTQSIYDSGLQLGFTARTADEACNMALADATIFTALSESRRLGGTRKS